LGDDDLPHTLTQNQPPTQNLSTIATSFEHMAFGNILEVELQLPANNNNASTTAVGSCQNVGRAISTQTKGGTPTNRLYGHLH
jgi:hypothetical protein